MSLPGISIIVGCYMQEKYVEQAYWSAKNQLQPISGEIEVIVNHDGCHSYAPGTSASKARNSAIKNLARYEWIICLDADDLLPVNYAKSLAGLEMNWMADNDGQWFAGCPVQFISGRELARFGNIDEGRYTIDDFRGCVPPIPSSALFSRAAWEEVGGYDESLVTMEDFDFWYKLLSAGYSYLHTMDTCLLKNNDSNGKVQRTPQSVRAATIQTMNERYGLTLELPRTIK